MPAAQPQQRPIAAAPTPSPARQKPARKLATKRIIERKPKTAECQESTWDPFADRNWTAIPDRLMLLFDELTKAELQMLLTIARLTWGQKKDRKDALVNKTAPMALALLCKEARLDRRTGDETVEALIFFGLIGRGAKRGVNYQFWLIPENWPKFKRPELVPKAAQDEEDEEVEQDEAGDGAKVDFGGFTPNLTIRCGERSKPIAFTPAVKEHLKSLEFHTTCSTGLWIQQRIDRGKLVVSIADLQQTAATSLPSKSLSPRQAEIEALRSSLERIFLSKHILPSEILCSQLLHLKGSATTEQLTSLIERRTARKEPKDITDSYLFTLARGCADDAAKAQRSRQADEAAARLKNNANAAITPEIEEAYEEYRDAAIDAAILKLAPGKFDRMLAVIAADVKKSYKSIPASSLQTASLAGARSEIERGLNLPTRAEFAAARSAS